MIGDGGDDDDDRQDIRVLKPKGEAGVAGQGRRRRGGAVRAECRKLVQILTAITGAGTRQANRLNSYREVRISNSIALIHIQMLEF